MATQMAGSHILANTKAGVENKADLWSEAELWEAELWEAV